MEDKTPPLIDLDALIAKAQAAIENPTVMTQGELHAWAGGETVLALAVAVKAAQALLTVRDADSESFARDDLRAALAPFTADLKEAR